MDDNSILIGNLKDKKRVWTKLGAVRLGGTMEQFASYDSATGNVTFANGFAPLTSGCAYVITDSTGKQHKLSCRFSLVEEGVYLMRDLDNKALTGKTYDITAMYIHNLDALMLTIQNFDPYDQYKVRVSAPLFVGHGARDSFVFDLVTANYQSSPWTLFNVHTSIYNCYGYNIVYEAETFSAGDSERPNLRYTKQESLGTNTSNNTVRYGLVKLMEKDLSPDSIKNDGKTTIILKNRVHGLLAIGTYFELWGRNDE